MQPQKRPIISTKVTILLLFVFALVGVMLSNQFGNPSAVESPPLKDAPSASVPTTPVDITNKTYRVVIDPGHGGKDPGATGASGREEKEYALSLATKIFDLLKQDSKFEPYLTRSDDTFIELEDRAKYANDLYADALISIHGNTFIDSSISGTETYYFDEGSIELAQAVHDHVVKEMGFADRGVRTEGLRVLTHSTVPAILAEVGYLTNKNDESTLLSNDGQNKAAHAIVNGLKQYFAEKNQIEKQLE